MKQTSDAEDVAVDCGAALQAAPTGGNRHRQVGVGRNNAQVRRQEAGVGHLRYSNYKARIRNVDEINNN